MARIPVLRNEDDARVGASGNRDRVRVVLVQWNQLFRESLVLSLGREEDLCVVRAVGGISELQPHAWDLEADLFVVDICLPGHEGLADARELSQLCPRAAILMIGLGDQASDVLACCEAGASGYLSKDASLADLVEHVRAVAAGKTPCSPQVAALLFTRLREHARTRERLETLGPARLTRRELEVIARVDQGLSNKEIAVCLGIELQTVKNHVHNILEKLELNGRHAAVRYARERGLLPAVSGKAERMFQAGSKATV